jgi:hypothetical protein
MKHTAFNRPLDWQAFERLTRDLARNLYGDLHIDLYGRIGQAQGGLDIFDIEFEGRRIGYQCKGRNDASFNQHHAVTEAEFLNAIALARENFKELDVFVFVTTGPNSTVLKDIAAEQSKLEIDGRKLKIKFHGWDWFESHLSNQLNRQLAIDHGLVAAILNPGLPPSEIALEIGERFKSMISMINNCEPLTIQSLARHLGEPNWRRFEDISNGIADFEFSELDAIAAKIGVCPDWLIKGTSTPFAPPRSRDWLNPMDIEKEILSLSPQRIHFVRKISHDGHSNAIVVLEVDDIRWRVFPQLFPIRGKVGSGGESQILEFLCLVRRLRKTSRTEGWRCGGMHIAAENFDALVSGEAYPASLLRNLRGDPWWDDFGDLVNRSIVDGGMRSDLGLAISSARMMVERYRRASVHSHGHRTLLEWAALPLNDAREAISEV